MKKKLIALFFIFSTFWPSCAMQNCFTSNNKLEKLNGFEEKDPFSPNRISKFEEKDPFSPNRISRFEEFERVKDHLLMPLEEFTIINYPEPEPEPKLKPEEIRQISLEQKNKNNQNDNQQQEKSINKSQNNNQNQKPPIKKILEKINRPNNTGLPNIISNEGNTNLAKQAPEEYKSFPKKGPFMAKFSKENPVPQCIKKRKREKYPKEDDEFSQESENGCEDNDDSGNYKFKPQDDEAFEVDELCEQENLVSSSCKPESKCVKPNNGKRVKLTTEPENKSLEENKKSENKLPIKKLVELGFYKKKIEEEDNNEYDKTRKKYTCQICGKEISTFFLNHLIGYGKQNNKGHNVDLTKPLSAQDKAKITKNQPSKNPIKAEDLVANEHYKIVAQAFVCCYCNRVVEKHDLRSHLEGSRVKGDIGHNVNVYKKRKNQSNIILERKIVKANEFVEMGHAKKDNGKYFCAYCGLTMHPAHDKIRQHLIDEHKINPDQPLKEQKPLLKK